MTTVHSVSLEFQIDLPVLHRPACELWLSRYSSSCFNPPQTKLTHNRALGTPRDIDLWTSNVRGRLKSPTQHPKLARSDYSVTAIRESLIPKIMANLTTMRPARKRCILERGAERATGLSQMQALPILRLPEPLYEVEMSQIRPPPANLVALRNSWKEA